MKARADRQAVAPQKAPSPRNASEPLPGPLRTRGEASLGVPLSMVRVYRDSPEPDRHAAVGVSVGNSIHLAPGAGLDTLGHELVHFAQGARHGTLSAGAAVSRSGSAAEAEAARLGPRVFAAGAHAQVTQPRSAAVHRQPKAAADPSFVIELVGGKGGALGGYPALREALNPAEWNALSAGARRRMATVAAGGTAPPAESEAVSSEVSVPLYRLVHPKMAMTSTMSGGGDWQRKVYDLALSGAGPGAMAAEMQREILARWSDAESGILAESVTVALIDPKAAGKSAQASLLFSLRGQPVQSQDGSLLVAEVDKALDNYLPGIIEQIQSEVASLERAIGKGQHARGILAAVRGYSTKSDSDIAVVGFDEADKVVKAEIADLSTVTEAPYSDFLAKLKADLRTSADTELPARRKAYMDWREKNPRKETSYDMSIKAMDSCSNPDGILATIACSQSAESHAMNVGVSNIVTGGGADQVHQLGKAYDAGKISFSQYQESADAVETRGLIFGGVMVSLTIATMGIGIVALPAEAGLGSLVLFGAGAGIVTTAGPMLASNAYTSFRDLNEPGMQDWWKGTVYSGKDILIASAIGGGLGALFPIAGRVVGSLFGKAATSPLAGSLAGDVALPEGVVARTLGKEAVELSIASEGVTIEVGKTGMKVFGPAGNNPRALLSSSTWEEMGMPPPDSHEPIDILHPNFPTRVGMGDRGWLVVSPQSAQPVQFGMWDQLALSGALSGGGSVAPAADAAMLPTTMPVALDKGGSMVFSGGTGPPWQKLLASGPQPYGLLTEPTLSIEYLGPSTPPNFNNPLGLAGPYKRFGWMALAPMPSGGAYVHTDSGPRIVAYPGSPTFGAGGVTTYGAGPKQDFRMDFPSGYCNFLTDPNCVTFKGARRYLMSTTDMRFGNVDLARSHGIPNADTKIVLPGQTASTYDAANYVAHPRTFNERFRRTIEGRLRKDGQMWGAYDILGDQPKLTQGGFFVPEGEYIVQFGPNGKISKAWYFPFDNLNAYNGLTGDIDTILDRYAIDPAKVPMGKIHR